MSTTLPYIIIMDGYCSNEGNKRVPPMKITSSEITRKLIQILLLQLTTEYVVQEIAVMVNAAESGGQNSQKVRC